MSTDFAGVLAAMIWSDGGVTVLHFAWAPSVGGLDGEISKPRPGWLHAFAVKYWPTIDGTQTGPFTAVSNALSPKSEHEVIVTTPAREIAGTQARANNAPSAQPASVGNRLLMT